jgi:hypothetical protein
MCNIADILTSITFAHDVYHAFEIIGIIFSLKTSIPEIGINQDLVTGLIFNLITNIITVIIAIFTIKSTNRSTREYIDTVEKTSKKEIDSIRENIAAVQLASNNQIKHIDKWNNIKRKQLLNALIEELQYNLNIYDEIKECYNNNKIHNILWDFSFVVIERCLEDTPIDDNRINKNNLNIYVAMKLDQEKIQETRRPYKEEYKLDRIKQIVETANNKKEIFGIIVNDLKEYEKKIILEGD